MCQDLLLSQLPASVHPVALAAAGQGLNMYNNTSDGALQHSDKAYEEEDIKMHANNGRCTLEETGGDVSMLGGLGSVTQTLICCMASSLGCARLFVGMVLPNLCCLFADAANGAVVTEMDTKWGIPPFLVERGPHTITEGGVAFEFRAPTTARNALRVLRALQLKRSVLLEGSPGVGKTALVAALAKASGKH